VTIILKDEGREIVLPARTAEILRRVIEVMADVERIPVGRVTFHFKGRSVIPEVSQNYRKSEMPGQ
jgi:hypothetical protein